MSAICKPAKKRGVVKTHPFYKVNKENLISVRYINFPSGKAAKRYSAETNGPGSLRIECIAAPPL